MDRLLTVIIPTYNMEKYLDKCLTSLIIKDYELMKQLEVLVIIDGANDRSSEIAHTYQDRYPEIFRVINKKNGNYGSCVNRGLKEAIGKYVKILDADDWFYNRSLSAFLKYLNRCDTDLVLNAFNQVALSDNILSIWRMKKETGNRVSFSELDQYDIHMHSFTYKLEFIRSTDYKQTEGISYTDTEWIFYPVSKVDSISYFSKPLYAYLVGREGQTIDTKIVANQIFQLISIVKKMINFYNDDCRNNENEDNAAYLLKILLRTCFFIYYVILVDNNGLINKEKLIDFDKAIMVSCPELYYILGNKAIHPAIEYLYIKEWRKDYDLLLPQKIIEELEEKKYKENKSIVRKVKLRIYNLLIQLDLV